MKKILVITIALWSLSFAFFDGNWIWPSLEQDMKAITGNASAQVTINGATERASQELQPMGPGSFGAEAKVEKVVDGISARASSSTQIFLPAPVGK